VAAVVVVVTAAVAVAATVAAVAATVAAAAAVATANRAGNVPGHTRPVTLSSKAPPTMTKPPPEALNFFSLTGALPFSWS
jgi:hypothetical protein